MAYKRVPLKFGEWMPDVATRSSPANEAKGVLAQQGDYVPFKSPARLNGTLAASAVQCRGVWGCYDIANAPHAFMGDATKLYNIESSIAVDRSIGGGYAASADRFWSFEQFGQYVIAVFKAVNPQVFDLTTFPVVAFANLGGSPPQADVCGRVREFLFLGADATLTWSGFNNITTWTPSSTTQAGTITLETNGGPIKKIIGGETGTVFQERQINRFTYIGPPTIWDRAIVEERRGCISQNAAVKVGRVIYYVSEDGFYVFDGYQSQPIGMNRIDEYFLNRLNFGYRHYVQMTYDAVQRVVICAFPAGSATLPSELLIYSISDNRWTHDDLNCEYLGEIPLLGYNLDTLDTFPGASGMDSPSLGPIPIDSPIFTVSRMQPALADTSHALSVFSGVNRPAIIETQETELEPGRRGMVTEIWPLTDAPTDAMSVAVISRAQGPGDSVESSNVVTCNETGFASVRTDARFLRAKLNIASGAVWTHAEGLHAKMKVTGAR